MSIEIDLSRSKYCFAIPAYDGKLCLETHTSMLNTTNKLTQMGVPWCAISLRGCALVDSARNQLFHKFLHETDADILVFIDADISWDWESMERLLVWSNLYPCIAGVYCSRIDPPKFTVNVVKQKLNEHGLLQIEGVGLGFTAITRSALEYLNVPQYEDKAYDKPLKQFCKVGLRNGKYIGEDIDFFMTLHEQGIPSYADPGIELKHHGNKTYSYQFKDYISEIIGENNGLSSV